jgi:uncharacterized delta-60 repeat protein
MQSVCKLVAWCSSGAGAQSCCSPTADFALARYNPDGSLDPSFASSGTVLTDLTGVDDLQAVAIQPDGKIVAVGTSEPTWATPGGSLNSALARYTPDGRVDPGFGTDGSLLTDVQDRMNAVAIQGDSKIVAAGHGDGGNFTLARLTPDGRLDATFGTGGTAQADFGNSDDEALAVAIQGDGKIVAAGRSQTADTVVDHFALARYTTDGALDPSFAGGTVITRFAPAYTRVASLSAAKTKHGVLIRWRTMSERGSRGFNVYRARYVNFDVGYTRLAKANVKMLRSKGSPTRGASYSFLHRRAPAQNDYYWIKEVKRDGKQVLYGPTQVKR